MYIKCLSKHTIFLLFMSIAQSVVLCLTNYLTDSCQISIVMLYFAKS